MNSPSRIGRSLLLAVAVIAVAACGEQEPEPMPMYSEQQGGLVLTASGASHFARLALDCIHREYPNKLNQVLESDAFLKSPRELHPAFYGCFDWHSSVHGHWMLVKLVKTFPDLPERDDVLAALGTSLTAANIAAEVGYMEQESSAWERTYGWAWLLQLATELGDWDNDQGSEWSANLEPLAQLIRDRYIEFLPRQDYAIRTGVHPNTAFGIAFALDYARASGDEELETLLTDTAMRYFGSDRRCPLSWEPSGEDFLSPCLEEAALMARILPREDYEVWLGAFLPGLGTGALSPVGVSDRADGKIAHLDGLNLSRAWDLYIIADSIDDAELRQRFRGWAGEHLQASLPHVASEHYEGSHWLGSFAVYALTRVN